MPYADTWDRSGEPETRLVQQQIVGDLAERCRSLDGSLEERGSHWVNAVLSQHSKLQQCLGYSAGVGSLETLVPPEMIGLPSSTRKTKTPK
jgi:hypothetical protein